MFKINHEEAGKGFQPIEKGDYEVTVINFEAKKAKSGNNVISVDYEIRSDVQQPSQGQKILYDNFVIVDTAMWKIQSISKAVAFPNGKEFESYTQWANELLNKTLLVTVDHRKSENGKIYPEVKAYKESKAVAPSSGPITVSDDELPF
ncbi:DUF669 domain-containing protein [Psychrobacillus sp. FSL K6-1267]|uniref:DUF669 domain-containing protein n=1 Tax=Psychrobacillus sp. FSL K6-1267 TaxID=2921543 RepID=UPI0030F89BDD